MLVVTAIDVYGAAGEARTTVLFDARPVLLVTSPSPEAVARPQLRLTATCSDDDACTALNVFASATNDTLLAAGTSSLDVLIWLGAFEGRVLNLQFVATDSVGQTTRIVRTIYVDGSAHLTVVDTVGGPIWDNSGSRVLFLDESAAPVLKIHDRSTGLVEPIAAVTGRTPLYGYLTPSGAIFVAEGSSVLDAAVYEWRSGALTDLGFPNSGRSLRVKDGYAIWSDGVAPCCGHTRLIRRDLAAGTNVVVADPAGNTENDIATNGDVAYWKTGDYDVYRFRNGTSEQISADTARWNVYPITDGSAVVWRAGTPCCSGQTYSIVMNEGTGEIVLSPPVTLEPVPWRHYAIEQGWVAFTRVDNGGALQVWSRSPTGAIEQRTFFGSSSTIAGLAPSGDLMIINQQKLYLSSPGSALTAVASALGHGPFGRLAVTSSAGQWWTTVGSSLFRVSLTPVRPPGAPTNVMATVAHRSAAVSWTPPADSGDAAITSYTVTSFTGPSLERR